MKTREPLSKKSSRSLLIAASAFALATACASPPPKITADDVERATEAGSLPDLYEQIQVELQSPDVGESAKAELRLRLDDTGRRLGAGVEAEVEASC